MRRIANAKAMVAKYFLKKSQRPFILSVAAKNTNLIDVAKLELEHLRDSLCLLHQLYPISNEAHERFQYSHYSLQTFLQDFVDNHHQKTKFQLSELLLSMKDESTVTTLTLLSLCNALFSHINYHQIFLWLINEKRQHPEDKVIISEVEERLHLTERYMSEFGYLFEALDLIHYPKISLSAKAVLLMNLAGVCKSHFEDYKRFTSDRKEVIFSALSDSTEWQSAECVDLYGCLDCRDQDILSEFVTWHADIKKCLIDRRLSLKAKAVYIYSTFHRQHEHDLYYMRSFSSDKGRVFESAAEELYSVYGITI
ncbi:hypothetical protein [Paenibacillus sp. MMO-58]|uniref:hypothetical protein n=1 Tax=Paenibacillus sp. MMO-58 TaxID=3081290 RepID=UPI0030173D90